MRASSGRGGNKWPRRRLLSCQVTLTTRLASSLLPLAFILEFWIEISKFCYRALSDWPCVMHDKKI